MKKNYFKKSLFLLSFALFGNASSQVVTRNQAPLFVHFNNLKSWTTGSSLASSSNISTVPLATRIKDANAQVKSGMNFNMKIDWVVDGIDRWNNYIGEINKFNTYNFTNWAYIDKFTWFSNNDNGVYIPPKGLVDAAHKNGVKVVGCIMMGGFGSGNTLYTKLLETDVNGSYIAAKKLVDIADYYNFDGYLFNMEAVTTSTNAAKLQALMLEIQTYAASKGVSLDISWYDSLMPNGSLQWTDQLNSTNRYFFQSGSNKISDSFFTNYNWNSTDLSTSINTANNNSRSPFDVYMGSDAWTRQAPNGYLYNKNFMNMLYTSANRSNPRISLALYAYGNLMYEAMGIDNGDTDFGNIPSDWSKYYLGEQKFFSGDDANVEVDDPGTSTSTSPIQIGTRYSQNNRDLGAWRGFGYYLPVKTVVNSLPFETYFNLGQGKIWSAGGTQTTRDWSDMGKQDILPSWQWAVTGSGSVVPRFDADLAYNGGTSIKLYGNLNNNSNSIKLYQTQLDITNNTKFDLIYKATNTAPSGTTMPTNLKLLLYFADNITTPVELELGDAPNTLWNTYTFDLSTYGGRTLSIIGVKVESSTSFTGYTLNLGGFNIYENQTLNLINVKKEQKMKVYPNPVKDILNLKIVNNEGGELRVYNMLGQVVSIRKYSSFDKKVLDVSNLPKGMYIIKYTTSGETFTEKILKE